MEKTNAQNSWHEKSLNELTKSFNTDTQKGLTDKEVERRVEKYGKNKLPEGKRITWYQRFF